MRFIYTFAMLVCAVSSDKTCCSDGMLSLKADNEKYLCRVTEVFEDDEDEGEPYTAETIQALKSTLDASCRFTVHNKPNGTVSLQADNGKYLCRMDHQPDFYSIEASTSILNNSAACFFKVHNQPDATVMLQTDKPELYLRRVDNGEFFNFIFPKDPKDRGIDVSYKFSFVQDQKSNGS